MVVAAGADVPSLAASSAQKDRVAGVASRWPLDAILSAMQILAEARGRMRGSPHGRLLIEIALCRVARLENFSELSELLGRLAGASAGKRPGAEDGASKKKLTEVAPRPVASAASAEPVVSRVIEPPSESIAPPIAEETNGAPLSEPSDEPVAPTEVSEPAPAKPLDLEAVEAVWPELLMRVGAGLGVPLSRVKPTALEPPDFLVIGVPSGYNWVADKCDLPESRDRISASLKGLLGRPVSVRFARVESDGEPVTTVAPAAASASRADEVSSDPMIKQLVQLFEARRVRVDVEEEVSESG
jgi:DNA polymerase-3 subunit gamma/tau